AVARWAAWAWSSHQSLRVGHRAARIGLLIGPRVADPAVRRVVTERHRALVGRAGEHVEVVHGVAGCGDARTVVAARDEEHVAVPHGHGRVDRPVAGVRAVHAEALPARLQPVAAGDPEVVDLLVDHFAL